MSGDHNLKADPLVAAAEPIDNKRLTKWLMRTKILRSFTLLSRSEDNKCAECGVTSTDDSMTALYCVDCFSQVIEAAVLAEREACAKVADKFDPEQKWSNYGAVIARYIRERGKP
jgi:hypothetical protein